MKLWNWAKEYALADHFFMGAFGGSYLNHQWLICACTPWIQARRQMPKRSSTIRPLKKRPESPPSCCRDRCKLQTAASRPTLRRNTSQPPYQTERNTAGPGWQPRSWRSRGSIRCRRRRSRLLATRSAKGVSWACTREATTRHSPTGRQDPSIKRSVIYTRAPGSPIFQPITAVQLLRALCAGQRQRAQHLKDGDDFLRDIDKCTLPAVSFYKPEGVVQ